MWTKKARTATLGAFLAVLGMPGIAAAADLAPPASAAQENATLPALDFYSPWQIRVRALGVITNDKGKVRGVAGSNLSYSDTVVPELDISYYFTRNISTELILGTTYADIHGKGSIASLNRIGKTWVLPPTLTLQYHFTNFGAFQPYVGAGVNYTVFYNQKANTADALHVHNTFGAALQVGFDYMLNEHWGVNFDVKKIFLQPKFDVTVAGARLKGKAKLDPWFIGSGITYRF